MGRNILIVETLGHIQYLETISLLLPNDNITFVFSERYYNKYKQDLGFVEDCDLIVKPTKQTMTSFCKKNEKLIKSADAVFFNTITKEYGVLTEYLEKKNVVLTVHNAKNFLGINDVTYEKYKQINGLSDGPVNWLKYVKYYFIGKVISFREKALIKKIINSTGSIVVLSDKVGHYLQPHLDNIPVVFLPYSIEMEKTSLPIFNRNDVRLTMLGNISSNRKDFLGVINALDKGDLSGKVVLSIMGLWGSNVEKEKIGKRISLIKNPNLKVQIIGGASHVTDDKISENLKTADFFVAATCAELITGSSIEKYGFTKGTGCEFDAQKYGRLMLNNSDYPLTSGLEAFTIQYKDYTEFVEIVNKAFDKEHMKNLYNNINFDIEAYIQTSQCSINDLIEKQIKLSTP